MKHFMTWWENEPTDFHLWTQYKLMKFAWKAALRWALSLKEGMEGSEVINPEDIEKELEE